MRRGGGSLGGASPPVLTEVHKMMLLNPRPIEPNDGDLASWLAARRWLAAAVLLLGAGCEMATSSDDSAALGLEPPLEALLLPEQLEPTPPGDRFQPVGTNPFVMAAHDPLSTFATDADTASYDLFVRDIRLGALP